jgi:hypothetical protein
MFFTTPANWRSQLWGEAFSYYMQHDGVKRESLSFYCPDRPLYIYLDCGAVSTVLTLHDMTLSVIEFELDLVPDLYLDPEKFLL